MPMKWLWPLLLAPCLAAADLPRVLYSKSFPTSALPYVAISVDKAGQAVYKESPEDDNPIRFQLEPRETAEIFSLTEKLSYFSKPLESGLKVANMGMKTFRFEDGGTQNETKFNYTRDADGRLLADWFERMTETVQHFINLERTAKFDRLGVDRALLLLQVSLERNRLVGAQQLLPVLDRIAKNHVYINRSRGRAAGIAEVLRAKAESE
jgi:hypothetical protein